MAPRYPLVAERRAHHRIELGFGRGARLLTARIDAFPEQGRGLRRFRLLRHRGRPARTGDANVMASYT
ncbi:hypothetical protein GCM10017786_58060 [Amycolatopsis deserti]|uniref:Urease accessory protein UreD n=1 Tax=Amycolatopsis deserti TaxID=185696 RepID=A0ABQ3JE52_9PSEU|nr:hypothetical protein GCM10017786_58060 [Amycolatopsis deserti]